MVEHHRLGFVTAVGVVLLAGSVLLWPRPIVRPRPSHIHCATSSVGQRLGQADLVITGHVFAVVPFGVLAEVLIQPDWVYRGTPPATGVNVVTTRQGRQTSSVTRGGGLKFSSGPTVYVLALDRRVDGRYTVGQCSGSRLLGDGLTAAEKDFLGPGHAVDEATLSGIH